MKAFSEELEGQCLIASPGLPGDLFSKSIVLVTHHESTGSLGVIFNRSSRRVLGELMHKIPDSLRDVRLYEGGPVEKNVLTLIGIEFHGNCLKIQSHLAPDGAAEFLRANQQGCQIRGYLGYAGWAAGQLEGEILRGDWKLMPLTPALIEPLSREKLWQWAYTSLQK
jgi:putative transcriptional regulator